MVRSAAKNHGFVTILTDPADYLTLVEEMNANDGATTQAFRTRMAGKAYARTAAYDSAIASWFAFSPAASDAPTLFPETLPMAFKRADTLRYGENPHQAAAIYVPQVAGTAGVPQAAQLQGKELSYNNLNDADAALELAAEFAGQEPAVVIVKHANPCGVAQGGSLLAAWEAALACDSVSAFGGIVAVNTELDGPTAEAIAAIFTEVVIAPSVSAEAREIFAKKKNLRLLECGALPNPRRGGLAMKTIAGGMLIQSRDNGAISADDLKVVTKRAPTDQELKDCLFAWTVARHVKSNAIVYAKDGATAGIGAGQMNRRDSARIAAIKAREAAETYGWDAPRTVGSSVASDAFFPFADGLISAAEAGATAVIQPGGSIRDDEVIAAADAAGLAMVCTGMRHFRH
jgi:phosphoribosylaminoimidazolecarboxamide formyltransferase/IMP cyclohydrolase